jgi:hypothetical protein
MRIAATRLHGYTCLYLGLDFYLIPYGHITPNFKRLYAMDDFLKLSQIQVQGITLLSPRWDINIGCGGHPLDV